MPAISDAKMLRSLAKIPKPLYSFRVLSTAGISSGKPLPPDPASPQPQLPEVYKQLENLDFFTAAKIVFSDQTKKKFGLDFHLVQFFLACMPSLAVYLVAQYARHEIKRMEAEEEVKRKKMEEEEQAKQAEAESTEESSSSALSKVIFRLDALEEAVKEMVDEKKKTSINLSKDQHGGNSTQAAASDKSSSLQQAKSSSVTKTTEQTNATDVPVSDKVGKS